MNDKKLIAYYFLVHLIFITNNSRNNYPQSNTVCTMGSKRKHSEVEADASENGRARENPGFHAPKKSKNAKKSKAKSGSMNWIKKRARTIERRFKTGQNLPANIRIDLERELAHHQEKLAEVADEKKRKNMISKYHMVRFFGEDTLPY